LFIYLCYPELSYHEALQIDTLNIKKKNILYRTRHKENEHLLIVNPNIFYDGSTK